MKKNYTMTSLNFHAKETKINWDIIKKRYKRYGMEDM